MSHLVKIEHPDVAMMNALEARAKQEAVLTGKTVYYYKEWGRNAYVFTTERPICYTDRRTNGVRKVEPPDLPPGQKRKE